MKKYILFSILILMLGACNQKKTGELITEKIQYDVIIKPDNLDSDWWVNNLEGSKREKFVLALMDDVLNHKINAFDFFTDEPLSYERIEHLKGYQDTILFQQPEPPYSDTLMVVDHSIEYRDITKVRFLESWSYNGTDIRTMEKKIIGIAPMIENYDEEGNLRGYEPLFWIYTDK